MSIEPLDLLLGPAVADAARKAMSNQEKRVAQENAYAEMHRRWGNLIAWQVAAKAPETRPLLIQWQTFTPEWDAGKRDEEAIKVQAVNLATAEGNAQLHGYSSVDVPALTIAEKAPTGTPKTPAPTDTRPPPDEEQLIPTEVKMGLVGAAAVGTVATALVMKSDLNRAITVGVGGAGVVALTLLLFAGGSKKKAPPSTTAAIATTLPKV